MITICIDESGRFEKPVKGKVLAKWEKVAYMRRFVGGFIYLGEDYDDEKIRIESFLKEKCDELGLDYPKGIHTTEMNSTKDSYGKKDLVESLQDYIKASGKYYFTMLIKSKSERNAYKNISNIVDDDNASNLYEHMVCQLLNNILFYNEVFKNNDKVNLEIATRSISISEDNKDEINKYISLGYTCNKVLDTRSRKNKYIFYLTDQRTFKAALSTKIIEADIRKRIHFNNINVKSINYSNESDTTPFLYFADFVVDMIKANLDARDEIKDFGIESLHKFALEVTGNKPLLWAYDDIDTAWKELFEEYLKGNYFECLYKIQGIKEHNSPFTRYYMENWIKGLENNIFAIFDPLKADIYISQTDYLFNKKGPDYYKGLFIALTLWNSMLQYDKNNEIKIEAKHKFRVADLIVRGYNHIGEVNKAMEFKEICEGYKNQVDIIEYITTLNRFNTKYANEFRFEEGMEGLKYSSDCLDILKKAKIEIANLNGLDENRVYTVQLRGKVLSSLGQFYAFKREKDEALNCFREALVEFDGDEKNRITTISYILHLAIDSNDRNLYKEFEEEYFETLDIKEQFSKIINTDSRNLKSKDYMMFVYIKAIQAFYNNEIPSDLIKKIMETDYKSKGFKVQEHPWEIIYKYFALISRKNEENYIQKIYEVSRNKGLAMELISIFGEIYILTNLINNIGKQNKPSKTDRRVMDKIQLIKGLLENNDNMKKYFISSFEKEGHEEIVKSLKTKFTYMYV